MGTDSKPSLPEQQEPIAPEHEGKLRGSHLGRFLGTGSGPPLRRRLRFAVVVVISQLMLIALAIAWLIHMIIIAVTQVRRLGERRRDDDRRGGDRN